MALTDKLIRGLKPRQEKYSVADAGGARGLYVVVVPSGRKFFRARLKVEGETSYRTLEPDYPHLSLAAAREAVGDHRREVRRRATALASDTLRMTVSDLFQEWDTKHLTPNRKDPEAVRRAMKVDVLPHIGDMLVRDVSLRDLVLVVDRVVDRGSVRAADVLRSLLLQMFKFAAGRGIRGDSPAALLPKRQHGRHAVQRERVLDDEEIRALWAATAATREEAPEKYRDRYLPRVTPYTKRVLRLLLLTGMRRSEVVDAQWSDIDLEEAVWTVPAVRSKTGKEHAVPLSDLAIEVIEEQKKLTGGYDYVFASPKSDFEKPMGAGAVSQAVRDSFCAILGIEPRRKKESIEDFRARTEGVEFTPHDLRRTVRSRLSSLGVNHIVARKILNHVLDGMDAIYDRHDYEDEKADALQRWANELRTILEGGDSKVVPLRRRRARA